MLPSPFTPGRVRAEVLIVLTLSLGASALSSVLSIIARLTAPTSLAKQTTSLNSATNPREWVDFCNQLLDHTLGLAPVALVLFLLWRPERSGFRAVGMDFRDGATLRRDTWRGLALVALIGIPGILLYAAGRVMGITVAVVAAPLDQYWWTIPMLILAAARAALTEEIIVVAYLFDRLGRLGWGWIKILIATSLLRGSYHLYQGIGPFIGNVVMGLVFGWCYRRYGRVAILVIAHFIIDVISFVGYPLAVLWWPGIFGSPV